MRISMLLALATVCLACQGGGGSDLARQQSGGDEPSVEGTIGPAQVATLTAADLTPSTLTPDEAAALATAMERSNRPDSGSVEASPGPSTTPSAAQP
jgi:hypothetical protein